MEFRSTKKNVSSDGSLSNSEDASFFSSTSKAVNRLNPKLTEETANLNTNRIPRTKLIKNKSFRSSTPIRLEESDDSLNDELSTSLLEKVQRKKSKSKCFPISKSQPSDELPVIQYKCPKQFDLSDGKQIKQKRQLLNLNEGSSSAGVFYSTYNKGSNSSDDLETCGWNFKKRYCHGLFTNPMTAGPLSFVLSLKNSDLRKKLNLLIPDCGGRVEMHIGNIGPHTVVLIDDDINCWLHTGDVFKVSYIRDCLNEQRILDISPYRKNSVSNLVDGFDYMKIFYFRKYVWSKIPQKYIKNNLENSSHDNDEILFKKLPEIPIKNTRALYSVKEREDIVKYIVEYSAYSKLKGREFWTHMEDRKVCPNRTWQSMKEHFIKHISKKLHVYEFLSENQRRRLRDMQ